MNVLIIVDCLKPKMKQNMLYTPRIMNDNESPSNERAVE